MASGSMKGYFKQKKSGGGGGRGISKTKPSKKSPAFAAALGSDVVKPSTISAHNLQSLIFSPNFSGFLLLLSCNFVFDFLIIFNF